MTPDNPLGLNGFEFVEFTSPDPEAMGRQFEQLGFTATHRHPTKNITRYKQGRINLMLNRDEAGRVAAFRETLDNALTIHATLVDQRRNDQMSEMTRRSRFLPLTMTGGTVSSRSRTSSSFDRAPIIVSIACLAVAALCLQRTECPKARRIDHIE